MPAGTWNSWWQDLWNQYPGVQNQWGQGQRIVNPWQVASGNVGFPINPIKGNYDVGQDPYVEDPFQGKPATPGGTGDTSMVDNFLNRSNFQTLIPRGDLQTLFTLLFNRSQGTRPMQFSPFGLPQGGLSTYLRFRRPWQNEGGGV